MRLRCPSCGQGRALTGWFSMARRCSACNFWFEREDGYFVGATAINMGLGIVIPAAVAFTWLGLSWPRTPWTPLGVTFVGLAVIVPLVCFPLARMLWLSIDLVFRPIQPAEYHHEHALSEDAPE